MMSFTFGLFTQVSGSGLLGPLVSMYKVGGRVVRRCWVNFQCRGVLLIWIGQGPIVLAVGVGGGCLDIFSQSLFFSFSLSLGDGLI